MSNLEKISWCRSVAAAGEGERIRRAAGLSIAELAAQIGVHPVTLRRWETGTTAPTTAASLRWFDVLISITPHEDRTIL